MSSEHNAADVNTLKSHLLEQDPDLRDIVQEFIDGLEEQLREFEQAYRRMDWEVLATLAHRLKGAGGSYGYPDISQVCAEMERAFRAQQADDFCAWLSRLGELADAARKGLSD